MSSSSQNFVDYEFDKYKTTVEKLKGTLEEYGVAILTDVLNPNECQSMQNGMWDYLEHVSFNFKIPIRRNDKKTWREYRHLLPKHSMLLQHWGVGHAQFIWDIRQHPKVMEPFYNIHGRGDSDDTKTNLLCSFDGASFGMPPEVTNCGWFRGNGWLHTDQSLTRNGFECVQSWVTGFDVNPGDATLTILEGSHKLHGEFGREFKIQDKSDWFKLNTEQIQWYKERHGCLQKYIQCPAGSMVFWDSRTIHSGQEASRGRKKHNFRCVAYVCMTPKNLCSTSDLVKRRRAFEELRMTNHWPHKPKLFAKNPRTYGAELPNVTPIAPPTLTSIGRQLVGY